MTRNYIPKHKTPFLPIRWMYRFDRHNFYWACHFSRRYHRLKNKERWQVRISKIRNEPIKSGTDLNDITEWGEYEVVTDRNSNCLRDMDSVNIMG